jgi:N-acetylmuramoyl-L-alanine amidase
MKNKGFLSFIFLFLVFSLSNNVSADVQLKELRYKSHPEKTRVVAEIDTTARYEAIQSSPRTISLNIVGLRSNLKKNYWSVNDGLVRDILLLNYSTGVKIVINLSGGTWDYTAFSLRDPDRIVIDIFNSESQQREIAPSIFLKTVVIDAGHGGKDPGAVGPTGLKEKTITLDIAKRLRDLLEAEGLRVILTRENDEFASLRDRVVIANTVKADLFISLHCNAAFSSRAKGFESYFLSPASDDLARAVAAVENSVIMMEADAPQNKEMLTILVDLKYTEYRKESKMLAEIIQSNLSKIFSTPNRGVKSALFYVLKGIEAPAVLVEYGFISNHSEERQFKSGRHRQKLAEITAESILQFKKDFDLTAGFTK